VFLENRIAVRFAYEWRDDSGHWFRSYGNENWEFDEHGLMRLRIASINDLSIKDSERKVSLAARSSSRRPSIFERSRTLVRARRLPVKKQPSSRATAKS
jgi:nuclear transport factor 2 (NTF2) superfamily protein